MPLSRRVARASTRRNILSGAQSYVVGGSLRNDLILATKQDEPSNFNQTDSAPVTSHPGRCARMSSKRMSESENQQSSVASSSKRKCDKFKSGDDVHVKADSEVDTKSNVLDTGTIDELEDDSTKTCSICLEIPGESECTKLDGCMHLFCFGCIEKWSQRENTCPLCKIRFNKIERLSKTNCKGKKKKGNDGASSKKIKNRDQSADLYDHGSIQGLLASLRAGGALPPTLAEVFFSVLQGRAGGPLNASSASRSSARNSNGPLSSNSNSTSPVVVSLRQTYRVQRSDPTSSDWNPMTFPFFTMSNDSDEDDESDDFPLVLPGSIGPFRRIHIDLDPPPTSRASLRTRTQASSQRSYAVSGQGSADMPLEIQESDDEVEVVS